MTICRPDDQRIETVEERLHRVMALHFDPKHGAPFWIERVRELGIDPPRNIRRVDELAIFGEMNPADLAERPLVDYIPRKFHNRLDRFVLGQTGGTAGGGTWTAYRDDELAEAFIVPFVVAANHVGFPAGEQWLYVGPTGPHIIGKVVPHLAGAMGSTDPFSVDFDPRWARKLPEGTFARDRYTQHVVDQALAVIETQHIGVLFTTPPVLDRLATAMGADHRGRIRGVHYGGVAISPQELERFQLEVFPRAIHLSGYGNTLFGCCLELAASAGRPLDYYPYGNRLLFELLDDRGEPVPDGEIGTVCFTRLDESMLIVRMHERDQASSVSLPKTAPEGYSMPGVRNPHPQTSAAEPVSVGLY